MAVFYLTSPVPENNTHFVTASRTIIVTGAAVG